MSYKIKEFNDKIVLVPVKVLNKRKSGWLKKEYFIKMRSLTDEFISTRNGHVWELASTLERYSEVNVGDIFYVGFHKHLDGRYRLAAE